MKSPLGAFLRASSLHIGAAAATASIREELICDHALTAAEIDEAYAVSRVTPGTNLLALYAQLGHRLGGWKTAILAIAIGAAVPAVAAVLLAFLSERQTPWIAGVMAGARAGGIAVFLGAAVRLIKPQIATLGARAIALALVIVAVAIWVPVSPIILLLTAAAIGAATLRPA